MTGQTLLFRRCDLADAPELCRLAQSAIATDKFYGAVFGWTFTDYGPGYSSFEDGRLNGGLRGGEKGSRGGALVVIYAKSLEAVRDAVVFSGGTIVVETHEFPGGRRFHGWLRRRRTPRVSPRP